MLLFKATKKRQVKANIFDASAKEISLRLCFSVWYFGCTLVTQPGSWVLSLLFFSGIPRKKKRRKTFFLGLDFCLVVHLYNHSSWTYTRPCGNSRRQQIGYWDFKLHGWRQNRVLHRVMHESSRSRITFVVVVEHGSCGKRPGALSVSGPFPNVPFHVLIYVKWPIEVNHSLEIMNEWLQGWRFVFGSSAVMQFARVIWTDHQSDILLGVCESYSIGLSSMLRSCASNIGENGYIYIYIYWLN